MARFLKRTIIVIMIPAFLAGGVYFWFPGLIIKSAIHSLRWWAGLKRHEVQVDDHRWVYLAGGEGETILFIHGFGADKDRWGTFLTAFCGRYRLIAPDLPGFGESSRVASANYNIPGQVDRLSRFIEKIHLDRFHLVGISMGGYIAAYYAGKYPDRLKTLALMDAAGVKSRVPGYVHQRFKQDGKILLLYKTPEQFDAMMSVVFLRPPWVPHRFKTYFAEKGALNYEFHEKILREMVEGGMDLLESRLSIIRARTLIIWGKNDRITNVSSVEKLEKGIANSRTVIIDECGHVPYLEKPAVAKRAYREFLDNRS